MLSALNNRYRFKHRLCSAVAGGMMLSLPAQAVELAENVDVHGFVSQAYIDTSANNFFGQSEGGSFDFRELGVNGFWQVGPNLNFAAQVTSRNAGRESDSDPRLDYGLADLHFYSESGIQSGIRVGRIKVPLGLHNQTRDAPSARNGIFVPASVYFDQFRNALVSTDGVALYTGLSNSWGDINLELYHGESDPGDREMEYYVFKQDAPGHFDDASLQGAQLRYESMGGGVRLALSYTRPSLDYIPNSGFDPLGGGDVISDMLLYSAQYNVSRFSFTAEYLLMINNVKNFGPAFPDFRAKGKSYYLQTDYRYSGDLSFFFRYGKQIVNDKDPDGTRFTPSHVGFGRTRVVGAQWQLSSNWLFRAEYHKTNGTAWLSGADNPVLTDAVRKWEIFALQAVYSF